jgi:hypothetical protein
LIEITLRITREELPWPSIKEECVNSIRGESKTEQSPDLTDTSTRIGRMGLGSPCDRERIKLLHFWVVRISPARAGKAAGGGMGGLGVAFFGKGPKIAADGSRRQQAGL